MLTCEAERFIVRIISYAEVLVVCKRVDASAPLDLGPTQLKYSTRAIHNGKNPIYESRRRNKLPNQYYRLRTK
jgi:hypothetical protein